MRRLTSSLEELCIGVIVCDLRGRAMFRNSAADVFVSARHGEALVADALEDLLERALAGSGGTIVVEVRGEPSRAYEVAASPIEDSGELLGAVALVEDITELHRVHVMRRDFVANVSHELKTPIGALSLLADSLSAASSADSDSEAFDSLVGRIRLEARRASDIIDSLLALSRIEAGQQRLDEAVDVGLVVGESLGLIAEAAARRGVRLSAQDAAGAPLLVLGSRVQLVSALSNLLDNAVKFTDPGGWVEVAATRADGSVVVAVRDNGVGIPVNEQPRIFERFYRVDRSRGRSSGGTGLGLSIVQHVVLNHGGDVTVESREGRGAAFTISLPAHEGRPDGTPSHPRDSPGMPAHEGRADGWTA